MPSTESNALAELYEAIAAAMANIQNNDLVVTRALFESPQFVAGEPTDVTYEDVVSAGGNAAIWAVPAKDASSSRAILYTHGGGFMTGSPWSHRKLGGHLAKAAGARVLLLHYRRSPEHVFPAQLDDTVAAYRWLLAQGYKAKSIAFAGDSAGGNLATAAALKVVRDKKEDAPAAVVAFSPWYDMTATGPTMEKNAGTDKLVQKPVLGMMADAVMGSADYKDPFANPLYADPKGMPPVYLAAGTWETLEGDVDVFAENAKKAGVDVTVEKAERMQHVHVFMAGRAPEADETIANVGKWLRQKMS